MMRKNIIKIFAGILVVFGVYWILRCQCINLKAITPAGLRDYIQGFGNLAALVYILAYALNTISIIPPIAILSLMAGLAFGKAWGAVYLMTGAMFGTSATFFISRLFGRNLIESLLKGKFKRLDEVLEKRGFVTVLFFRVIPIIPYEVLNYIAGLSKIKFRDYFFATLLGLIPGVAISAFFGGTIGDMKSLKDLFSVQFLVALGLLVLIASVPFVYQHIKKRRGKT